MPENTPSAPAPQTPPTRPLSPGLRRPPAAGGPRRVSEKITAPARQRPTALKKALPYLISGGSIGLGIGGTLSLIF